MKFKLESWLRNSKLTWILTIFILLALGACKSQREYMPEYRDKWNDVESFIHKNWHTSRVDSSGALWLKKIGIVPPKPFMSIAKGNPLLFYWDNYFTNKGLLLIDSLSIYARNVADDLLWEVDTLGFVPNANMNWGMNRSQTPFLAQIVYDVYAKNHDKQWLTNAYYILKKEYHFWTDTSRNAIENHNTAIPGLQRFYHHASEKALSELYASCFERGLLQKHPDSISQNEKLRIAGHYAAEAESGMDFNPRFENRCADFIPVELNSNLYKYEMLFDWMVSELSLSSEPDWKSLAEKRKMLINKYCWNEERGLFMDYDFVNKKFSPVASVACMYPMVTGIATKDQAEKTVKNLHLFEHKYGITVCEKTQQPVLYQWDYPAGWPPMYQLTAQALHNYGFIEEALRVCGKYLDVVTKNYIEPNPGTYKVNDTLTKKRSPGFVYEKYDVVTGGINDLEYNANEFLGWSAGVYIWCLDYYNKNSK